MIATKANANISASAMREEGIKATTRGEVQSKTATMMKWWYCKDSAQHRKDRADHQMRLGLLFLAGHRSVIIHPLPTHSTPSIHSDISIAVTWECCSDLPKKNWYYNGIFDLRTCHLRLQCNLCSFVRVETKSAMSYEKKRKKTATRWVFILDSLFPWWYAGAMHEEAM